MLNNFVSKMCNYFMLGFFLALMLITPLLVSYHPKGNLSRSLINQTLSPLFGSYGALFKTQCYHAINFKFPKKKLTCS